MRTRGFTRWSVCTTSHPFPTGYGIRRKNLKTGQLEIDQAGITKDQAVQEAINKNPDEVKVKTLRK
jgi:hypothetical protein